MPMKTTLVSRPLAVRRRPLAEVVAGDLRLSNDFGGGQIADQGLGPGVAEAAVEGAADLAGEAQRAAAADIGNEDGLGFEFGPKAISHLMTPVAAFLTPGDVGRSRAKRSARADRCSLAMLVHGGES